MKKALNALIFDTDGRQNIERKNRFGETDMLCLAYTVCLLVFNSSVAEESPFFI